MIREIAALALLLLAVPGPLAAAREAGAPGGLPRHAMVGAGVEPRGDDSAAARRQVLDLLDRMVRAMATRDTALLTSLFLPGARLVGMRPREQGPVLQVLTVEQFVAFVVNDRRERWVERLRDPEVRIDGTLATVWARYDFHFGDRFSHCGTDAFQLLRGSEGWKIASLADTYRTEGCSPEAGRAGAGRDSEESAGAVETGTVGER